MIDFTFAKLLGFTVENKFFGEAFQYASVYNVTVKGTIYDLTNQSGVEGIWSGISGVVSDSNDYDNILLNGVSFGPGRINSIRFTEGTDVRMKDYEVELETFHSGDLSNLTGQYYSGLDFSMAYLLDHFSENFTFNVEKDSTYTYDHSVSCKFISTNGTQNTIPTAKVFASGLLFTSAPFGFVTQQYSGFFNEPGKRTYKENYNLINNECSFIENFKLPAVYSGAYSAKFDYAFKLDEKGISSITENGAVQGIIDPIGWNAQSGYEALIGGAYARCSDEFASFAPGSAYSLNAVNTTIQKKWDIFNGVIDYSITFDNNPVFQGDYSWEYTLEQSIDNCVKTLTEAGKIKGLSVNCTFSDRLSNAMAAYGTINAGIEARLEATFAVTPLRLVSYSEDISAYNGEINYKAVYTNQLAATSTSEIRKIEVEAEDDMPVELVNKFVAFGFGAVPGEEVVQDANIATPGRKTITVKVYGVMGVDRSVLLAAALTNLNNYAPIVTDPFVDSCGYTWETSTNTVTAKAKWNYFSTWSFSDTSV